MPESFLKTLFSIVLLVGQTQLGLAGSAQFDNVLRNLRSEFEAAVIVQLTESKILKRPEMEASCGTLYEGNVIDIIGLSDETDVESKLAFISNDRLSTGGRYLVFVRPGDPFLLPKDQESIDGAYQEAMDFCTSAFEEEVSGVHIRVSPAIFEVASRIDQRDYDWIDLDVSRYWIDESIDEYKEDVERCLSDEQLKRDDCELMHRRTLIPLDYVLQKFIGEAQDHSIERKDLDSHEDN